TVTLGDLQTGDKARVSAFRKSGSAYRRKLLAMGLTPGTCFRVCRVAPLGDPVQLQVRGFQLSLRRHEAVAVEVVRL
ncbi:FeoA family protein, partial [Endozoicomonas sp. SESOKO4]